MKVYRCIDIKMIFAVKGREDLSYSHNRTVLVLFYDILVMYLAGICL